MLALTFTAYWRARAGGGAGRRLALAALRTVSVIALAVLLLRPMRAEPVSHFGQRPLFAVLVDQSASMKTPDLDGKMRDTVVRNALDGARRSLESDLARQYDVHFFTFDEETRPAVLDEVLRGRAPTGPATDVAAALLESANVPGDRRLAGVLLISDGRDNAGGDVRRAATFLKAANTGVWTVAVGSAAEAQDVFVTARLKQGYLFVNQPGAISVSVSHAGFDNEYATVSLYRDDELIAGEQVALTDRGAAVEFPITEKQKGVFRYRVETAPIEGESDTRNNSRTVFVRVVDEKTRVLFAEARPYWDSKFLLRALQHDPNVEVTSLFQLKPDSVLAISERSTDDPAVKTVSTEGVALPRTKEDLYQYDCLVFGKGVDGLLTPDQLALVRDYVRERGGGVVFARGRSYGFDNAALAALEPLVWERDAVHGTRFELTPEGRINPAFAFGKPLPPDTVLRELPEMVSVTKVSQEKSLAIVLARSPAGDEGTPIATIAYQRYGKGKVMSVGATGMWRWSIMPEQLSSYDDIYERFWAQMIRWLVSESDFLPGQEIALRTDRFTYDLGDTAQFTVRTKFLDNDTFQPAVAVKTPSGKDVVLQLEANPTEPGAYSARYLPEEEGEFRAQLRDLGPSPAADASTAETWFTVYADSVESRLVAADPALLEEVASITGAECLGLDQLAQLPDKVREFERAARVAARHVDAWDSLGVFVALVAFLSTEWFLRRRNGLV